MSELPEDPATNTSSNPFRERLTGLIAGITAAAKNRQGLDAHSLERFLQPLQKQGLGFYSTLASILLSTYFISDLISIGIQSKLPTPRSQTGALSARSRRQPSPDDYLAISQRNLFSSEGKMPGEEGSSGSLVQDQGGTPVRTTLPFNLVGTIILRDELRSIATIEDKSA